MFDDARPLSDEVNPFRYTTNRRQHTVTHYPTDLSDSEWTALRSSVPPAKPNGTNRITSMRSVVDAILYRQRCRCPWRMLPHDFPHWRTVYGYYTQWQADGTWKQLIRDLRNVRRELKFQERGGASEVTDEKKAA
jgi:putative transposase